ncbi:hypothetical protein NGRA_0308 [Nosema granulosis]|uniref:Uncharacterized protein n=1 Tax=Nosema granulosis TaxID=83296 RepID=A0A9P6L0G4_9MICR|nr:hypothetical protein NGRA_0308 [Nosema granulosis]
MSRKTQWKKIFFLLLFLNFTQAEELILKIFYEKKVDKVVHELHSWFAEQVINKYNDYLRDAGIIIKMDSMVSLLDTDNTEKDIMLLSALSGSEDITERKNILKGMPGSTIFMISTPQPTEDVILNQEQPCETKLISSFSKVENVQDDTMTKFISTFRNWLGAALQGDVPNIFDPLGAERMKIFVSNVKNSKIKNKLSVCNRETGQTKSSPYSNPIDEAKLDTLKELIEEIVGKLHTAKDQDNEDKKSEDKKSEDGIELPENLDDKKLKVNDEQKYKRHQRRPKSSKKGNFIHLRRPAKLIRQKISTEKNSKEEKKPKVN